MTKEKALFKVKCLLTCYLPVEDYHTVVEIIEALKPKTGYWIKEETPYGWDGHSYQCSVCGRSIHLDTFFEDLTDYPYCHCGVKMVESEE